MTQREEDSLIDEMRAAIRADRERAAARSTKPAEPPAQQEPPPQPPKQRLRRLLGR